MGCDHVADGCARAGTGLRGRRGRLHDVVVSTRVSNFCEAVDAALKYTGLKIEHVAETADIVTWFSGTVARYAERSAESSRCFRGGYRNT